MTIGLILIVAACLALKEANPGATAEDAGEELIQIALFLIDEGYGTYDEAMRILFVLDDDFRDDKFVADFFPLCFRVAKERRRLAQTLAEQDFGFLAVLEATLAARLMLTQL